MSTNKHVRRLEAIQARKATQEKQDAPSLCTHSLPFIPSDIGACDNRGVMDVALFRLSKKERRANSLIRYDLPDGYVQVSSGMSGMASIWDYDIVLMAVSHLTAAMNNYRAGKGEKPGQTFRPHIAEVLKFCGQSGGGRQRERVVDALTRLSTTHVLVQRTRPVEGELKTLTQGENLIASYSVVSHDRTGKVEFIEIRIAEWMYNAITRNDKPEVLTVHPGYFRITQGVGRFVYRLARRAAGKRMATWSFQTLYERSGSSGTLKEFYRLLRKVIDAQCLPEYNLSEEDGQNGSVLRIVHRSHVQKLEA